MNQIHPVYAQMARTVFDKMSGLVRELGAINLGLAARLAAFRRSVA